MKISEALAQHAAAHSNDAAPARVFGGWEIIGPPECPILARRTLISTGRGKLLLHRFLPDASDRDFHDHPSSFLTLVFWGSYTDIAVCPDCHGNGTIRGAMCMLCEFEGQIVDDVVAPAIRFRSAEHAHITTMGSRGAWTLCIMGPKRRGWGFWRAGKWFDWRSYERVFGLSFRCDREPVAVHTETSHADENQD